MRILVGCEYSGIVRDAFRRRGHDAVSCDLLPSETPGPHIQDDVLNHLNERWDAGIFHPPCTYITRAGAAYYHNPGRKELRDQAIDFFMRLWEAPIPKIAIENPRPFRDLYARAGRMAQEINPFEFGDLHRKAICLWLKNLPPLMATEIVPAPPRKSYVRKSGPKAGKLYHAYFHNGKNAKERARFFPGIAAAMADQWGAQLGYAEAAE